MKKNLELTSYTSLCIITSVHPSKKTIEWVGGSFKDLMVMPAEIRRVFGFALFLAQIGSKHESTKVLSGFGGSGVLEVVEDDIGGTYRAVYTVKFPEAVFVLHCFQKKSKHGIATPLQEMEIIRARLKVAQAYVKELRR